LDQGLSVEGAAGAEGKVSTEKKVEGKLPKLEDKAVKEEKSTASKTTEKAE